MIPLIPQKEATQGLGEGVEGSTTMAGRFRPVSEEGRREGKECIIKEASKGRREGVEGSAAVAAFAGLRSKAGGQRSKGARRSGASGGECE